MSRKSRPADPSDTGDRPSIARVYVRVSDIAHRKPDSGRELLSPDVQMDAGRAFARVFGYELDEAASLAHADIDQSGFRKTWRKRPGIMAHLEAARRGEFQRLVVYKLSRLARNAREGLEIFDEFEKAGVSIHVVEENIDTGTAIGRLTRTVLLAVAEMQSEGLSSDIERVHARRAAMGKAPAASAAWLTKNPSGTGWVIDERIAASFRRMAELRLEHKGYTTVARILNSEGLPTPTGLPWTMHAVMKSLTGRYLDRMAGIATYELAEGKTVRTPNAYPAIITDGELRALRSITEALRPGVGAVRAKNLAQHKRGAAASTSYLLSSRVVCAICGSRLIPGTGGTSARRAYRCNEARSDSTRHPGGGSILILAAPLEDAVLRVVRHALALQPVPPPSAPSTPRPKKGRSKPGRPIKDIEAEMSQLVALLLSQKIVRSVYDEHHARLEAELLAAEAAEGADPADTAAAQTRADYSAAVAAAATGDWRAVVLAMVARVEAPMTVPGVEYIGGKDGEKRYGNGVMRRCARVTLRWAISGGQAFIAPIYRSTFGGERIILLEDGAPIAGTD